MSSQDPSRRPGSSEWLSVTGEELVLPASSKFLGECKPISSYEILNLIGEGTYGIVHRARAPSSEIVALKQLRVDPSDRTNGIPLTALREMSVLRSLKHPNIVNVLDIAVDDGDGETSWDDLWMVMEYAEQDLASLIDDTGLVVFKLGEVKCLFQQLLQGLEYLHRHGIIHRDVKTENLLLTASGTLKLADFNTARPIPSPPRPLTPSVTTIWYSAPELLLSTSNYTPSLDLFSAGLILAELLLREPLLQADTPVVQLSLMIKLIGSPSGDDLDALVEMGCPEMPGWKRDGLVPGRPDNLGRRFDRWGADTVRMVAGLLKWDPRARWTAAEALGKGKQSWTKDARDWWAASPKAVKREALPKWHEMRGKEKEGRAERVVMEGRAGGGGRLGEAESEEHGYLFDFEDPMVRRPAKRRKEEEE